MGAAEGAGDNGRDNSHRNLRGASLSQLRCGIRAMNGKRQWKALAITVVILPVIAAGVLGLMYLIETQPENFIAVIFVLFLVAVGTSVYDKVKEWLDD